MEWKQPNTIQTLPFGRSEFIDSISTISDSRLVSQIASIFSGQGKWDATIGLAESFILMGPEIRLVPYSGLDSNDLRLSLLSRIPWKIGNTKEQKNGILKLDLKVEKATWLTD